MGEAIASKTIYLRRYKMSDQDNVTNVSVENEEDENQGRSFPWIWLLVAAAVVALVILSIYAYQLVSNRLNEGQAQADEKGNVVVSWKDSVIYAEGGSGPADPASVFNTDMTTVNHDSRLIVENEQLDVKACFPSLKDSDWSKILSWSNKWGDDSPTRVEWQVVESRCSFVFPGNITDPISQEDYKDLLNLFPGYETWFVAGEEGSEFGRVTYAEIYSVDTTFNRVHVYGPKISAMPTK